MRKIPKLQESNSKFTLSIPRDIVNGLNWKKGDRIFTLPHTINKSNILLVNGRLYKKENPGLTQISEYDTAYTDYIKKLKSFTDKKVYQKNLKNRKKTSLKPIEISKQDQLRHLTGRRNALREQLREISSQIKKVRRRKNT